MRRGGFSRDSVCGDERDNPHHAHHGGIADNVIHAGTFENRLRKRHGDRPLSGWLDCIAEDNIDGPTADPIDPGAELTATAVEDGDRVAGGQSKHACQMVGFAPAQRGDTSSRLQVAHQKTRKHVGIIEYRWRDRSVGPVYSTKLLFRGQNLGKYKIVAPLGSGGFGTVYLAQDTWIDKKVAIKVPHRQGVDFGELLREPRLLASVNHPNIVAITTAEKQDNVFFIVMEYVHGETLENIIAAQGALDLNRALDFTCQICNAVDHAHRQGVIHRDLRPANVLVGEGDMLKVADFGTSRFLEIAAHGTTVIGSPPYMAPEQFHGKAVFASDLYSLGVTMYQMLTGVLPYDAPAPSDLDKLMSGELVSPPRLRNPAIPKPINDVVLRAMAPELTDRYQRASDLLNDVLAARKASQLRNTPRPENRALQRDESQGLHARLRQRETTPARFCWHCRKPLHARTDRCPFCGESQ